VAPATLGLHCTYPSPDGVAPEGAHEGETPEVLLEVAAILYTSAQGTVAEAFAVHKSPVILVSETPVTESGPLAAIASTAGAYASGSIVLAQNPFPAQITPAVSPASIPNRFLSAAATTQVPLETLSSLTKGSLLRQLGLLPERTLSAYLAANPSTVSNLLAAPPAALEVTTWWSGLSDSARLTVNRAAPQLVGNLDGIPTTVRNEANRVWLSQSIDGLKTTVASSPGRAVLTEATRQIHMLDEVSTALGSAQSVPQRSLLSLDVEGQGRAAVVLGDLATADYVTYLIPGMFFTVEGQINDWTDDAARIYDEQVTWLNLIGETDPSEAGKTVAVVSWMGYETPNLTNIGSLDLAYLGRDAIADVVRGLQSERAGNEPYISIFAHSYGSTAAMMALSEYSFEIDALAVIGSPGSAVQSVDDLHVRDGNVFVGEAAWDPVPNSAFFGSDPGSREFGAHHLGVGGGVDLITNEKLAASVGHNGYFGAGSESLRNLALIGIGKSQLVTDGSADDNTKTLALLE
jgi:hypothetical protein